ncbi:AMP-binding protein, partial [Paenibacillus graminis]
DVSVWELFCWFYAGAELHMLTPGGEKDPGALIEAIEQRKVTTLHFVPSMLSAFLEYAEQFGASARLASVKNVFASGEALNAAQVKNFRRLLGGGGSKLHNLYGPTETTVDVTYYDCNEGEVRAA